MSTITARPIVEFWLPIHTISEANVSQREHALRKHRRHKTQRSNAYLLAMGPIGAARALELPLAIVLQRHSLAQLDSDNLASSQKHIRDGVTDALAAVLGRPRNAKDTHAADRAPHDDSDRLTWFVSQKPMLKAGPQRGVGVLVKIYRRGAALDALRAAFPAFVAGTCEEWLGQHLDLVDGLLADMDGAE